ncbi:MAG: DUF1932 domain-containing protein [Chloroflexota bacterium]|nr:DUF1932 domain-containing protein [Chloroflexota bacterium]MDE2969966.1 DUF1932 domain-containing protein [Chloroflexota bacterium]
MSFDTIGLLGVGEMGSAVARTLAAHTRVVTTLEGRSDATRARAEAAGVQDLGSLAEVVRQSDLVLSVLASDTAPAVAAEVADAARRVEKRVLFGEFNAIAPVTVQAIANEAADAMDVVDGGIVGGPGNLGSASFYLSGPRAEEVASLREYGINTVLLGPVVGQASGAKLCHAGMTKGVSTLALDILLAAEALGVADTVMAQYTRSMAGVLQFVDRFVPGNPKRAYRRAEEMPEIARMLDALGFDGGIHRAAYERMRWLGSLELDTDGAPSASDVARRIVESMAEAAEQERA